MKINHKELGHVSTQWNSSFEGILLLKHKVESKKKNTTFTEHWCRLKGNVLVLCRSSDKTCTDVEGVLLLEHFTLSAIYGEGLLHAFRLEFDAGDEPFVFVARSEAEANVWRQHLTSAQLLPTLRRIGQIREELRIVTGADPLDFPSSSLSDAGSISAIDEIGTFDLEGMELSLSCENLPVEIIPGNVAPNIQIVVCVCTPPNAGWTRVGTTELVQSCSNPKFLRSIFIRADRLSENARVQFEIFDLRDIKSDLGIQIGNVVVSVDCLLSEQLSRLPICDPTTGLVVHSFSDGPNPMLVVEMRKQKPPRVTESETDTVIYDLGLVGENLLSKRYSFEHVRGERLHVVEFMGESKLCFDFPVEYLKSLIPREHLLYESLSRTGFCDPRLERMRKELLITMKQTLQQYEACLRHMVDCSGTRFKPSWERTNPRYDFVPTNLHVNQISVTDADGVIVSSYNITTAGAFAASSRSLKSGGLFRTAANTSKPFSSYPPSCLSVNSMCQVSPIAAAVCLTDTSVAGRAHRLLYNGTGFLASLRGDLVGLVQRLSARDQTGPLTERMQRMLNNMHTVFSDSLLREIHVATAVNNDFRVLSKLLVELSALDKLESAPSPRLAPHMDFPDPIACTARAAQERSLLLVDIDKAGEQLTYTLDKTWDACAEILWHSIFSQFLSLVESEPAVRPADAGPSASHLIAEAERMFVGNVASTNVDTALTALSVLFDGFAYRHHASLCQALTTLLSALLPALPRWNQMQWKLAAVCGILAQFEGLLSCFGSELGMIEDWAWAIGYLSNIRIVLRPYGALNAHQSRISKPGVTERSEASIRSAGTSTNPLARMTGTNECELTLPWSVWKTAPNEIQSRGRVRFRIHAIAFLVGINEQQTIAEKLDKTAVQLAVNNQGLASLEMYFQRYTKHYGAPPRSPSGQDVCDLIANIRHVLTPPLRSKPVELLKFASEITQAFGGLRFTSCKSAKDRTSMSVTLEQIRWLMNSEGLQENNFQSALECIRRTGLRMDNVFKNTGCRKYAFNRLQLLSFPRLYRPPVGTYALGVNP